MSHAELIEELQKSDRPRLELDGRIWCAVNDFEFVMWDGAGCVYRDPRAPKWDAGIKHADAATVRPFTVSIDAAMQLCDGVMGRTAGNLRFEVNVRFKSNGDTHAQIYSHPSQRGLDPSANHRQPAMAICIALLKGKGDREARA